MTAQFLQKLSILKPFFDVVNVVVFLYIVFLGERGSVEKREG